jgi:hypothetical protein
MLAFKLQMPVNHPEESTRHSEHGESLKSRKPSAFSHEGGGSALRQNAN